MSAANENDTRQGVSEMLNEIVVLVAKETHETIRKDDYVMILPIIMKVLLNEAMEGHKKIFEHHESQYEYIFSKVKSDSKELALTVLNASLEACRQQIAASAENAAMGVQDAIKKEMDTAINALRDENEAGQRIHGPVVLTGGILAFLGGVAVLVSVILKIL